MARNDGHPTNTPSPAPSARDGGEWPGLPGVHKNDVHKNDVHKNDVRNNVRENDLPSWRASSTGDDEDDDFDPRLLDLDEEEESPFLRANKRVPVRRGPLPRKTANRVKQAAVA